MRDLRLSKATFLPVCILVLLLVRMPVSAQTPDTAPSPTHQPQQDIAAKIGQLSEAIAREQEQLKESQKQLDEMMQELNALRQQMAQTNGQGATQSAAQTSNTPSSTEPQQPNTPTVGDLAEQQAIQQSEISTHEQTKVESASKYPVKISGLLLLNGFVNTNAVDMPSTPSLALSGPGSTGLSVSQTTLGIDATGPHLLGASSYADLSVDFFGSSGSNASTPFSGYLSNNTLLRLRTAHSGLRWDNGEVYFALDRPLISPDSPTSLTAEAEPPLAWAGSLWTWNPSLGASYRFKLNDTYALSAEAAVVDVSDAPYSTALISDSPVPGTTGQLSRRPGVMARIALLEGSDPHRKTHFGIGGYFAPHHTPEQDFHSWAATLDTRFTLGPHLELSGAAYRGAALGGLGAGAYKDFLYYIGPNTGRLFFRAIDDVGGWAQIKERFGTKLELNEAFGLDNAFSHEVRRYVYTSTSVYANLARNQAFTGNVIYSPRAYLQFSIEYRHLQSFIVNGAASSTNITGIAAGYRF